MNKDSFKRWRNLYLHSVLNIFRVTCVFGAADFEMHTFIVYTVTKYTNIWQRKTQNDFFNMTNLNTSPLCTRVVWSRVLVHIITNTYYNHVSFALKSDQVRAFHAVSVLERNASLCSEICRTRFSTSQLFTLLMLLNRTRARWAKYVSVLFSHIRINLTIINLDRRSPYLSLDELFTLSLWFD